MKSTWLLALWTLPLLGQAPPFPPAPPATPARVLAVSPPGSYLGIGIQEITPERARELKLREEAGVEVTRVSPDSPAGKAGIKAGDVVLQYNGTRVEGIEQLSRMVRETPAGREIRLDIVRAGAPQTVAVKIGQHPGVPGYPGNFGYRIPDVPRLFKGLHSPMLGVEVEPLEGQFAQYFGVTDGVLVRSVNRGSPAEKAGLKAGDVILRVDDVKVATPADITGRLRSMRGKTVGVTLMRERREMMVTVELPDSRSGRAEPVRLITPDWNW